MNKQFLQPIRGLVSICACAALTAVAHGQGFNSGSNGALGDVVIGVSTNLPLPADGKLHFRTLTVAPDVRLTFQPNDRNTPVFILSQGDVVIHGTIDVGGLPAAERTGGLGGPGGFEGGKPGFGGTVFSGNGYGPGGGNAGDVNQAGGGSYASAGISQSGPIYGHPLLIPLIGGSGGGGVVGSPGAPGTGGGGGGGALLISASTRIELNGAILARGGAASGNYNSGSGGAVRLVAPRFEGSGIVDVRGGPAFSFSGHGRMRVDTLDPLSIRLQLNPSGNSTVGANLLSFPPVVPALATLQIGDEPIPQDGRPAGIILPFGSDPNTTVKIQARDFGREVPIQVKLTPHSGSPVLVNAVIDNTTENPATATVPVTFPVNTFVTVHAWTREPDQGDQ